MRKNFFFLFACAVIAAQGVAAQTPVVRIKAKLTAFDGQVLTLEPLPEKEVLKPPKAGAPKAGMPQLPQTSGPQAIQAKTCLLQSDWVENKKEYGTTETFLINFKTTT